MRQKVPRGVTFLEKDGKNNCITWKGNNSELFRLTILEEDILRFQHFPEGTPRLDRTWSIVDKSGTVPSEGRSRQDLSPFTLPPFQLEEAEPNSLTVRTKVLNVECCIEDTLFLKWKIANDEHKEVMFASDLSTRGYSYDIKGTLVYHYMKRTEEELYYGFGEKSGPLNKHGLRMKMMNVDALAYNAETSDPLYKHIPFYITYVPSLNIAYGILYDTPCTCTFDMGKEISNYHGPYRFFEAEDGDIDYYFIFGPSIPQVVQKLVRLTGKPVLPPRWSLGYLGSTMSYTESPNAQEQLKQFAVLCRKHQIPCDLFHLSSGYTTGSDGKRYVFRWNKSRVPDPKEMVNDFHQNGIRLAANIKPCLLTTHPQYEEVKQLGGFVRDEKGEPYVTMFWGGQGSYLDFTNPKTRVWWKTNLTSSLLSIGIDSSWNDNNEYELWDDEAVCDGFGKSVKIGRCRPVQTLLMLSSSFEAQKESSPEKRVYLISRSGCPGMQRYAAQTWSGDNNTSWHSLKWNIPMGLGLSLSGVANTGHDIGGFYGYQPTPELFVRWVQCGVCLPRFCIHSWHVDNSVNEPWMYPEVLPLIRSAIEFRYKLIPYLYSLLFEYCSTGTPINRPLVYHYPLDPKCRSESFEFMLGPWMLIAPVVEEGVTKQKVYLPQGDIWFNFHTGDVYNGGGTIELDAPLSILPILVRGGGIVPMGKVMQHFREEKDDKRMIYLFPCPEQFSSSDITESSFELIEDDGESMNYLKGGVTKVRLTLYSTSTLLQLKVEKEGEFPLPYEELELVLPSKEKRQLQVIGGEVISTKDSSIFVRLNQ